MKVLYIITKGNWGGAQRYVFDLATAAKAQGFEVAVAYGMPGEMARRLTDAGIRTLPIGEMGRDVDTRGDFSSFGKLLQIIREERPDVVHLNSSKVGGLGALASRISGVRKIVFTTHGWAFNEDRPGYQKLLIRFFAYLTVLLSHQTICVSYAVKRDAAWMPLVQKKLAVILLGLAEPSFLEPKEARRFLFPTIDNGFVIGMLAELHKTKGIFEAIEAFAKVQEAIPDAYLVIMGEGEARGEIERTIAEHSLQKRVLLLGHVRGAAQYLKAFDIFLFPSRTEALGYALMEAGLASLPAVATNVGGIPELIENETTGLLVERKNIREITAAIIRLEGDASLRRRYGEALHTKIANVFSLEKMIEQTLKCYQSATAPRSTTTSTSSTRG